MARAFFVGEHQWPTSFAYTAFSSTDGSVSLKQQPAQGHSRYVSVQACNDKEKIIYVQLIGEDRQLVLLNAEMSRNAGFADKDEVFLVDVKPSQCENVQLAPLSEADFNVIESSASRIEESFLTQCTVVAQGMVIPLYASGGRPALLKVVSVSPETSKPVMLVQHTELFIAPVANHIPPANRVEKRRSDAEMKKVSNTFEKMHESVHQNSYFWSTQFVKDFRILPQELCEDLLGPEHVNDIFVIHDDIKERYSQVCVVSLRGGSNTNKEHFGILRMIPQIYHSDIQSKKIYDTLKQYPNHCMVAPGSHLRDYERFRCSPVDIRRSAILKSADVCLDKETMNRLMESGDILNNALTNGIRALCEDTPLLLTWSGVRMELNVGEMQISCMLIPNISDLISHPKNGEEICFRVTDSTKLVAKQSESASLAAPLPELFHNYGFAKSNTVQLNSQSAIVERLRQWVEYEWKQGDHIQSKDKGRGHALLLGPSHSGRTTITYRVAKFLAKSKHVGYFRRIDCATWKGKQAEKIKKTLQAEIKNAESRSPSVLILDNIDLIAVQSREEDHRHIALERIFSMLSQLLRSNKFVQILATAKSLQTINPALVAQGGLRFFGFVQEIGPLTLDDRIEILNEFCPTEFSLESAAKRADNFVIGDLQKFARRVHMEKAVRGAMKIEPIDIDAALEHSRPIGAAETTVVESHITLEDVGGMREQKKTLQELFLWPGKYADLFDRCGVRMGQGVLLSGPSGCGKTLLARAFAAHTKFQTIFIKGPELLSKYIGSSEENVRSAFTRARASAPCVLIFDELDSLAPRRGADSTGVTDRVVNQLLTEMDGAEGLQGVFIIGCTSRIDLIDPALLRPGRFDHKLTCGLPTKSDRGEILSIAAQKMSASTLNMEQMSTMTDQWTGADLQAWILNSQFQAARSHKVVEDEDPVITMEDVLAAYEESKPRPRDARTAEFRAGQRVTLA